jgi:hypothetical protein
MLFFGLEIIRRYNFYVTYLVYEAVSRKIISCFWEVFIQELLLCPTGILHSSVHYNHHKLHPI